ncbi:MAG: hypothetical protein OXH66_19450 [Gemmatimonadetes bacterium]|nr:hypothetical protein [Gemmatimonadota bacterium]
MTELERQLMEALKRLSAQSGTERRRQSEQVEALRRRVERLSEENEALQQRVERLSGENEVLQRRIERLDVLATRLAEYFGTSAVARPRGLRI